MVHHESGAQSSPALVLVAPLARRPIALVARRNHHRSSRAVPSSSVSGIAQSPLTSSPDSAKNSNASIAQHSSARLVSHPYTRTKTPSNGNHLFAPASPAPSGVSAWPLGLAISTVSPPPRTRSRFASGDGASLHASMELSTRPAASSFEQLVDEAGSSSLTPDEPMLASPSPASDRVPISPTMDVERTPTKNRIQAAEVSTPAAGEPVPAHVEMRRLILSPTSPTTQRIKAADSASCSTEHAHIGLNTEARIGSASVTPSPCLSHSLSRSPTTSPSPCPSPPLDVRCDDGERYGGRKMHVRLPPLPTSPIPRKMTRNPFERYLVAHAASVSSACGHGSGSLALHARLARAVAQSSDATAVDAIQDRLTAIGAPDADEEMTSLEAANSATLSARYACIQPSTLTSVPSATRIASGMDVEQ